MRQSTKEGKERLRAISEAIQLEMVAVNEALQSGKIAVIETFCGRYILKSVSSDFWYYTYPEGQKPDSFNSRSWAGCNDGTWEDIMKQLDLERHPLWRK